MRYLICLFMSLCIFTATYAADIDMSRSAIEKRIQPVGELNTEATSEPAAEPKPATETSQPKPQQQVAKSGKDIYWVNVRFVTALV